MPIGTHKNRLYGLALPMVGLRCQWKTVAISEGASHDLRRSIPRILRRGHVVGGCVQLIRSGNIAEVYTVGNASLSPLLPATADTVFRTASLAKMVCALLVLRLQTLGKLHVDENISAFWGNPIQYPHCPDVPITLKALLSHTSGIVDSPCYYRSFENKLTVSEILADGGCFSPHMPLTHFQYSNFAAGLIGSLLEKRFGESLETLMQREVFTPLGVEATFDLSSLGGKRIADSHKNLPAGKTPAFHASKRFQAASPLDCPDPERHFQLASGSLYLTALSLARLTLPLIETAHHTSHNFLSTEALLLMKTPITQWPDSQGTVRHGLGLLVVEDSKLYPTRLYGHQGIAYGAVNGIFFDELGNGFASLNSGASEKRDGHISCYNRELIALCMAGDGR